MVPHIILIPSSNYWAWVQAVRPYAIEFGVQVTPRPQNALDFNRPNQTVTIANVPNAYPDQGDIEQWFMSQEPSVTLDLIAATSPDQLAALLQQRIDAGIRFPEPEPPPSDFKLLWPTDYVFFNQGFGENPDLYRRFGLPGHEGVDIRAPMNAKVYACAPGKVYRVEKGASDHAYGIHVRIRHDGGYRTVYAHLNQVYVTNGQVVRAGDLIGLADSTGNSTGSHLHLTLKKDGATARGETDFPWDIIDPTPYLVKPDDAQPTPGDSFSSEVWPPQKALIGLHGRADGPMQPADWDQVRSTRMEALKLMSTARPEDVDTARSINNEMFIMVRLFADFRNRIVTSADFARWLEHDLSRFYDKGIRYFEVHNEPNLTMEGFGFSWRDGREFATWLMDVVGRLRPKFPQAKFGWPGLSPGPSVSGIRFDEKEFLRGAGNVLRQMDFVCCHCYWPNEDLLFDRAGGLGYKYYREEYPNKLLFITEFSNPAPDVDWVTKGEQYVRYYDHIRTTPGLGAAFSFVVSASTNFPHEVWRDERGHPTAISRIVANR